nr:2OG-Fe(II) oxygenase [Nucleocytoviricota sp.]
MTVPEINKNEIENLILKIINDGTILDGKLNNNNSKGRKLTCNNLPTFIKSKYMNSDLLKSASNTIGAKLNFAPETEQYRIFARLYQDENDWINFHYDNNFTK